jgi:hypothetical protein
MKKKNKQLNTSQFGASANNFGESIYIQKITLYKANESSRGTTYWKHQIFRARDYVPALIL